MISSFRCYILFICLFHFSLLTNGQEDQPTKAADPGSPAQPLGLGVAESSVNLFTGEVQFPLSLVSVAGRNGLDPNVSISYSSAGVRNMMDIENEESPTSILGLGWQMDVPQIVVDNKQTGSREDDDFYLLESGSSIKLLRTKGSSTIREYNTEMFQFWKILYYTTEEKWVITKEDGTLYIYGDKNSNRSTVQWIVQWKNWIGNSSSGDNQSRQGLVWNLSEIKNRWGDAITYEYENVENYVGWTYGKQKHTEASYPKSITSPTGSKIWFFYGEKLTTEYEEPHQERIEPDAYQERYEKKYLSHIEVFSDYGKKLETIRFGYNTTIFSTPTKRLLTSVIKENGAGEVRPGTLFNYLSSGTSKGCLEKVTNATGGTITYTYSFGVTFPKSKRELFIDAPYGYAEPEVEFGPDYVVVSWRELLNSSHSTSARKIKVYVYTWEGEWKEQFLDTYAGVELVDGFRKTFQTVVQQDFFAIARRSSYVGSNTYYISKYHKNPGQRGQWNKQNTSFNAGAGDAILLSGENFVALQTKEIGSINTWVWNGTTWHSKLISQGTGKFNATATNNYIVSHNESTDKIYFHYLDEQRVWNQRTVESPFISNDPSHWYGGNSFAVVLADDNPEFVYMWDQNYNNFGRHSPFGEYSENSDVFIIGNSQISIVDGYNSRSGRFDGSMFDMSPNESVYRYNKFSFGEDYLFYEFDASSTFVQSTLKTYNPNSQDWNPQDVSFSPSTKYDYGKNPLKAGNNLFWQTDKLYKRNSSGSWTVGDTFNFLHSSSREVEAALAKLGLGFVIYTSRLPNTTDRKSYINFIKNNKFEPSIINIAGYFNTTNNYQPGNQVIELVEGKTVVTADHGEYFEDAQTLKLHRLIDYKATGAQTFYPVTRVTVNDGYESRYTSFIYTPSTATVDPEGRFAKYNHVRIIGSHNTSTIPFGYTDKYYFNGLPSNESSLPFPAGGNAPSEYKLLTGANYATKIFNSGGVEVSNSSTSYNLFYKALSNSSSLTIGKGYYARPINTQNKLDGVENLVSNTFDANTGLLVNSLTTNHDSQGASDIILTEYKYWWQAYDTDRSENLFSPIIQTTKKVNNIVTDVGITKWKDWGGGKWGPFQKYTWKGTGGDAQAVFTAWPANTLPNSNWLKTYEVNLRDSKGNITQSTDVNDFVTSKVWGHKQSLELGAFSNAAVSEVLVEDFDDGSLIDNDPAEHWVITSDSPNIWWSSSDGYGALERLSGYGWALISRGGSSFTTDFIAEFEIHPKGSFKAGSYGAFQFNKVSYDSKPTQTGYSLRFFELDVKLYEGNTLLGSYTLSEGGPWYQVRIVREPGTIDVYLDGAKRISVSVNDATYPGDYLGFYAENTTCGFDNFRVYPSDAYATSVAYDKDFKYIKSTIGANYDIIHNLYNAFGLPVASTDGKGITKSTVSSSNSTNANIFDPTRPSVALNTTVRGLDGFADDFGRISNYNWIKVNGNNGITTSWDIADGILKVTSTGNQTSQDEDRFTADFGKELTGRVGVEMDLRKVGNAIDWTLGIALGGNTWSGGFNGTENAIWTSFHGDGQPTWEAYDVGWKPITTEMVRGKTYRVKILINVDAQRADYYLDGRLLKSDMLFRHNITGIQKLSFFNYGGPQCSWEIDNVVVYTDPVHSVVFGDAMEQPRQMQSEEPNNQILVSEILYDELGRGVVQTKPTRVNERFGYKPNFITGFNWQTGVMSGEVVTINNGDGSYPYSRTLFDNSPLSRKIESGGPGATYRIGQKTTKLSYRNNSTGWLAFPGYPAAKYFVAEATDPDGGKSISLRDQSGNEISRKAGPDVNGIWLTTKYEYDDRGNLTKILPPNYFNPPVGSIAGDYVTTMTYDHFGRLKTKNTPDAGTFKYIYDKAGRLRFMQDQNGATTASNYILYWKYDIFGRVTEEGYYYFVWNEGTLQANAEVANWPDTSDQDPETKQKSYTYGNNDHRSSYNRGLLTEVDVVSSGQFTKEVWEYDVAGNVIYLSTRFLSGLYTELAGSYSYNNLGQVTEISLTNHLPFTYQYDNAGRISAIGEVYNPSKWASYAYDKNGLLSQETLNNSIVRTFTYNSNGSLSKLSDNFFEETLYYETGGYESGYYSGLVAQSKIDIKAGPFANQDYHTKYKYDKLGRLLVADNSLNNIWDLGVGSGNETTYDPNGNITKLVRGTNIKNYKYHTKAQGGPNRLLSIDGSVTPQYLYDAIGNVTKSDPKNISAIYYHRFLNLPRSIQKGSTTTTLRYGATNQRVKKTTDSSTTFYIHGINDYPLMELEVSPLQTTYKYFIYGPTGLIASTRLTEQLSSNKATMEREHADLEEAVFDGISENRQVYLNANETTNGTEVARLMPGDDEKISLSLPVSKGDTFNIDVWAYYEHGSKYDPKAIGGIADALTGSQTGSMGLESPLKSSVDPTIALALATLSRDKEKTPAAFLNYILFDTAMNYVSGGFVSVGEEGNFQKERLTIPAIPVSEQGYLYVYLSNERDDQKPVYFDDLTVNHQEVYEDYEFYIKDHLGSTRMVIGANNEFKKSIDYMPFGNIMRESSGNNVSYQYTGQEYDQELGLHNYRARQYDSDIGRFYGFDPAEQFASPFSYAGNNPISYSDPNGEVLPFVAVVAIAGVVAGGINVALNWKSINGDPGKALGFFGVGFAAGAVGAITGGIASVGIAGVGTALGTGTALAAGSTTFGTVVGIGAAAGSSAGFIEGVGNTLLGGESFKQAMYNGVVGAAVGGITGAASAAAGYGIGKAIAKLRGKGPGLGTSNSIDKLDAMGPDISPPQSPKLPSSNLDDLAVSKPLPSSSNRPGVYPDNLNIIKPGDLGVKSFTRDNFRSNLIKIGGGIDPGTDIVAHHVIPHNFANQAAAAGVNVNNPLNGMWLPKNIHQSIHAEGYNAMWKSFFGSPRTKEEIFKFGQDILIDFGIF